MKWSSRNTINVILVALMACAWAAAGALPISDADRAAVQTAAIAALIGLLTPGSPIGRVIDGAIGVEPDGSTRGRESGHADPLTLVWLVGCLAWGTIAAYLYAGVR